MSVLALVPARGGSRGVPKKNTRPLAGRSLVERTCECALAAGVADRLVISTDDPEVIEIATRGGYEAITRPPELAGDSTPMVEVVIHALDELRELAYVPEVVMLLQPTSPFRRPSHLREALALLGDADSVCSVVPLPKELCPHYVMRISSEGMLEHFLDEGARYTRRQDVPQAYRRDGTVYLTRSSAVLAHRNLYGARCHPMLIDPEDSISIDTWTDWEIAEARLRSESVETQ